jgi:hypothetical protein
MVNSFQNKKKSKEEDLYKGISICIYEEFSSSIRGKDKTQSLFFHLFFLFVLYIVSPVVLQSKLEAQ